MILGQRIMDEFRRIQRLDYLAPPAKADPGLSFAHLFPGTRGHMFGLLECINPVGQTVVLRAFSSLRNGIRHIDGWVPPIHSDETWNDLVLPEQARIKDLTQRLKPETPGSPTHTRIVEERRRISRDLVTSLQDRLVLTNFRGEQRNLRKVFHGSGRIPGGVGDCCAPKLLNHAALNGLKPVGLAEFYWGAPTPSGGKVEGHFYPCCKEKCQPILGFMLCGLDELS
jgi:hypothetical protein